MRDFPQFLLQIQRDLAARQALEQIMALDHHRGRDLAQELNSAEIEFCKP